MYLVNKVHVGKHQYSLLLILLIVEFDNCSSVRKKLHTDPVATDVHLLYRVSSVINNFYSHEGTRGIEPPSAVWKTAALPLSYIPIVLLVFLTPNRIVSGSVRNLIQSFSRYNFPSTPT